MQKFREALDEYGLFDLGFVGNKFTWFKTYLDGAVWMQRGELPPSFCNGLGTIYIASS